MVVELAILADDPKMSLVGSANEVGEDADLRARGLHLAKDDVGRVKSGGYGGDIALVARETEHGGIADDAILLGAARSELDDDVVGEGVAETRESGTAGFVIEANDGENGRGIACVYRTRVLEQEGYGDERGDCDGDGSEASSKRASGEFRRCSDFEAICVPDALHRSDELIARLRNGADVERLVGIVVECDANLGEAEV